MNRIVCLLFTLVLLLIGTLRLPAPISEVPQAKPKREAPPRSKPKSEATLKPKARPNLSFAGTWTGTTTTKGSDGSSGSTNYIIKISDDEKTVWINWEVIGSNITGPGNQAPSNRFRDTLTWSFTWPVNIFTDTLRINADGTATFVRDGRWTGGDYEGHTYNHTGILSRQDVLSAPSIPQTTTVSVPQKTTTTAAPQTTGFPTAIPVPDKPGFVYNPFDPNKKRILDVRGIPSGTKVTIPASGKQFIVP